MKTNTVSSAALLIVSFLSTSAAVAASLNITIAAGSRMSDQLRAKDACYQALDQMQKAGLRSEAQIMRRQGISILPGDLYYTVYISEKGSNCALLDEETTLSKSSNFDLSRVAGCVCNLVIPID